MWVDSTIPTDRTVTGIRGAFPSVVDLLLEHGFDSIEIMIGNPFRFDLKDVSSCIRKKSVNVVQLCTGEYFGSYYLCLNHIDPELRRRAREWGERTVKLAEVLGCPMNIGRFRGKVWEDGRSNSMERMAEGLSFLDSIAEPRGVMVLLEPLRAHVCDTLNSIDETVDFIDRSQLSSTALMLDTDHTALEEESAIRMNSSSIAVVHLADTAHRPIGKGSVAFDRYFALLKDIDYDGPLSVEVFPDGTNEYVVGSSIRYLRQFITRNEEKSSWQWM